MRIAFSLYLSIYCTGPKGGRAGERSAPLLLPCHIRCGHEFDWPCMQGGREGERAAPSLLVSQGRCEREGESQPLHRIGPTATRGRNGEIALLAIGNVLLGVGNLELLGNKGIFLLVFAPLLKGNCTLFSNNCNFYIVAQTKYKILFFLKCSPTIPIKTRWKTHIMDRRRYWLKE